MASNLKVWRRRPTHVFEPRRPPFTEQRRRNHVRNSMRYLFASAGITDRGLHSLRHTAAIAMVNRGASFKDVSDVLPEVVDVGGTAVPGGATCGSRRYARSIAWSHCVILRAST
jgi:hypothetical protein